MGVVYRAKHLRLQRPVALKILHPDTVVDAHRKKRFLREARAASALAHPGIVTVYDFVTQNDQDILVMEALEGRPLKEFLPDQGLPWRVVIEIALQLGSALSAAHGAGIVHRDLKPSNVMILGGDVSGVSDAQGAEVRVKLLDFGIAKLERPFTEHSSGDLPTTLTRSDMSPGTLGYMSPEQALGESVDHRSDIFSLGILLYEMLTGEKPFQGKTPAALAHRLLFSPLPAIDAAARGLPNGFEEILRRAMAKKPQDRYQEMEQLCEDLRRLEDRSTVPLSRSSGLWRVGVIGALVAGAVGTLVLVGNPWVGDLVRPHGSVNVPPKGASEKLAQTPYQHYEAGMRYLERSDREGYVDASIKDFEYALELAPTYAPAWVGLALAHLHKFRGSRERTWLQRASQHANHGLELDPVLTDAGIAAARIKIYEGKTEAARRELERLQALDPQNADTRFALGEAAFETKDFSIAAEHFEHAIGIRPDAWAFHAELARCHLALGDFVAAEAAFRASLAMAPDNALTLRNLGAVLHYQGRFPEAVVELQKSITIRPTSRGYTNLGTAYFFQGLYREAATALEAARDLGANYYIFWSNLGDAYRQIPGKHQDAVQCFERAAQLLRREMETNPQDSTLRSRLATYLVKAGDPQSALHEMQGVGPLVEQSSHVAYRATLVYELAGQRSQALKALEVALTGGYPLTEIQNEPELVGLREDVAFHELALKFELSPES